VIKLYLNGDRTALDQLGDEIARAINDQVEIEGRVDTRRLRHSIRHIIENGLR